VADKRAPRSTRAGLVQEGPVVGRAGRPSKARARILSTADRLFYAEGIRAVGVQRVIKEAEVTRVTFYRHFPSKDELVVAYLRGRARQGELDITAVVEETPDDPFAALQALGKLVATETLASECRGCPFVNSSAEYGDPEHPARKVGTDHRSWINATTEALLDGCGHPNPAECAELLLILRTGAVVGSSLDNSDAIGPVFLKAWDEAIRVPHPPKRKK